MTTRDDTPEQRYRRFAEQAAVRWANRNRLQEEDEGIAAVVLLDALRERDELRERVKSAEQLASSLGWDMLSALTTAFTNEKDPERALLYLARGFKREAANLAAADTSEGRDVLANLPDLSPVD